MRALCSVQRAMLSLSTHLSERLHLLALVLPECAPVTRELRREHGDGGAEGQSRAAITEQGSPGAHRKYSTTSSASAACCCVLMKSSTLARSAPSSAYPPPPPRRPPPMVSGAR